MQTFVFFFAYYSIVVVVVAVVACVAFGWSVHRAGLRRPVLHEISRFIMIMEPFPQSRRLLGNKLVDYTSFKL